MKYRTLFAFVLLSVVSSTEAFVPQQQNVGRSTWRRNDAAAPTKALTMASTTFTSEDGHGLATSGKFLAVEFGFLAAVTAGAATAALSSPSIPLSVAAVPALHVVLLPLSMALYRLKELECGPMQVMRSLLFGGLELYRIGLLDDVEEAELRKIRSLPPLSFNVDSTTLLGEGTSPVGLLMTISLRAKEGSEVRVRKLLQDLNRDTQAQCARLVTTSVVDQEGSGDRRSFVLLQRFPSVEALRRYHNTLVFQLWSERVHKLLESPMGLYLANERNGQIGTPVHPFGPGGEGGREDAIFSSPTNIQGSALGN